MKKLSFFFMVILFSICGRSQNNVAIGTTTPDASAQLELNTTTQGLLLPRLTKTQRDAIVSPAEGLVIYNTTSKLLNYYDGLSWRNADGSNADELRVGQPYHGGIIAYIFQPGDPGYNAATPHGLIVTSFDQGTATDWGCSGVAISGADATLIGTGSQNTLEITNGCATAGIAARLCWNLYLGGYGDWYLPSKDELNKIYLNRAAIGGIGDYLYWSSSEYNFSATQAWTQDFANGTQAGTTKSTTVHVRAIRTF